MRKSEGGMGNRKNNFWIADLKEKKINHGMTPAVAKAMARRADCYGKNNKLIPV